MNSVWEEEESRARLETIIASRNLNNCIWSLWGTLPPTCHYDPYFQILSKNDEAFFHLKRIEIWFTLQISYLLVERIHKSDWFRCKNDWFWDKNMKFRPLWCILTESLKWFQTVICPYNSVKEVSYAAMLFKIGTYYVL